MNVKLPIVATDTVMGIKVNIRTCPFGLVRKMIAARGDTLAEFDAAAEIFKTCIEPVDGKSLSADELPADEVTRLVSISISKKSAASDFQTPPGVSDTAGAD